MHQQPSPQAAAGVRQGKVFRFELPGIQQGDGQRIAQRQRGGGAGGRGQPQCAGFFFHGGIEVNGGLARQCGLRSSSHGDDRQSLCA